VDVIALVKDRANTLKEVAQTAMLFYRGEPQADAALQPNTDRRDPPRAAGAGHALGAAEWKREAISAAFKAVLASTA
jgi:glutamyl-tRNA synthetase